MAALEEGALHIASDFPTELFLTQLPTYISSDGLSCWPFGWHLLGFAIHHSLRSHRAILIPSDAAGAISSTTQSDMVKD